MERKVCQHLGRLEDGKTFNAVPSEGNFCHHATPVASIKNRHQSTYCLTREHVYCPVYRAHAAVTMPPELAASQSSLERTRKKLSKIFMMAAGVLFYLVSLYFGGSQVASRLLAFSNPSSSSGLHFPIPVSGGSAEPTSALMAQPLTAPLLPSNPQSMPLANKDCSVPQGWHTYTVQPSDSVFRISILFKISGEELRNANCLDSHGNLVAGSVIFVPAPDPTATPTATNKPSHLPVNIIVKDSNDDEDRPIAAPPTNVPPTLVPPTAVPPTMVPPTAVPPTQAPVIVPAIPDPTKEDKPVNASKPEDKKDKDENKDKENNDPKDKEKEKEKDNDKDNDNDNDKDNGKDKDNDKGKKGGKD